MKVLGSISFYSLRLKGKENECWGVNNLWRSSENVGEWITEEMSGMGHADFAQTLEM